MACKKRLNFYIFTRSPFLDIRNPLLTSVLSIALLFMFVNVAFADERIADFTSEESLAILNENMRRLRDDADHAPRIYTGIVAPTSTPQKKGDMYLDTVAEKVYVATNTDDSGDWIILN